VLILNPLSLILLATWRTYEFGTRTRCIHFVLDEPLCGKVLSAIPGMGKSIRLIYKIANPFAKIEATL
jgi:hypothetical protein